MINRSTITMFNNHRVPRSCTNVDFIEAAVDSVVEHCSSTKGMVLLAAASLTVTGLGVWAMIKLSKYLEDEMDVDHDHASANSASLNNRM